VQGGLKMNFLLYIHLTLNVPLPSTMFYLMMLQLVVLLLDDIVIHDENIVH